MVTGFSFAFVADSPSSEPIACFATSSTTTSTSAHWISIVALNGLHRPPLHELGLAVGQYRSGTLISEGGDDLQRTRRGDDYCLLAARCTFCTTSLRGTTSVQPTALSRMTSSRKRIGIVVPQMTVPSTLRGQPVDGIFFVTVSIPDDVR